MAIKPNKAKNIISLLNDRKVELESDSSYIKRMIQEYVNENNNKLEPLVQLIYEFGSNLKSLKTKSFLFDVVCLQKRNQTMLPIVLGSFVEIISK
eukprot:Pgem_evm1s16275